MCTATPSIQAEQSPPVFYLPVHPTQLAVSLAPSVSGTPGVDPVLCSQQPELVLATGQDHHFGSGYGSEPNRSQIGGPGRQ